MVFAKILSKDDCLEEVNKILYEVFVNEYKFNEKDIFLIKDNLLVYHVLVYEGIKESHPVATGRLVIEGNIANLEMIAVIKKSRRKQYGDMVIRMLVEKARNLSCNSIEVDSPEHLMDMFGKVGFLPVIKTSEFVKMKYNKLHTNICKND